MDRDSTTSTSEPDSLSSSPKTEYCKVLIIGAGASGLQCANSLLEESTEGPALEPQDIILLEARNRVGGRVHTREYTIPTRESITNTQSDSKNSIISPASKLWIDDGAAWVHGTDPIPWDTLESFYVTNKRQELENPVMEHLDRHTELNDIVVGNPWTRPYSILHKTGNIAIFVQQESQEATEKQHKFRYQHRKDKSANEIHDNSLIRASIRRHYSIMRKVKDEVDDYYDKGKGIEVNTTIPLDGSLARFSKEIPLENDDRANAIRRLTLFYQHMLTYWQGLGLSEIPIGHYGGFGPNDNDDESSDQSDRDDDSVTAPQHNHGDDPLWDDADFDPDGDFGGSHCTVKGGMQKVIQGLSKEEIIQRVQLNKEVERIEYVDSKLASSIRSNKDFDPELCKIRVTNKDGSVVFAQSCVVTIPVGCLRENHGQLFSGTVPLSEDKVEAFEHLTMGRYKKVFLTFDSIFWPSEPAFMGMVLQDKSSFTSPLGKCLLVDNFWARDGHACMEAILAGDQGRWATGKSDDEIRDAVLEFLQTAMNIPIQEHNLKESCLDCHITRWEEDPYCRGAYAALSMGGMQRHTDAMNEPEWGGCLRFAGDTCSSEFEGSVPAAIFSGRYTSRNIKRYLSRQSDETSLNSKTLDKEYVNASHKAYDWKDPPPQVRSVARKLSDDERTWERGIESLSTRLREEEMSTRDTN